MPTLPYRTAVRVAQRLPLPAGKLADSLAGRRAAAARWRRWAGEARGPGPLLWVHAASVGEALTALPVVTRLRVARPDLQVVLSHSSPSVARWPEPLGVDHVDFVPADEPHALGEVYDALRAAAVLFARGDLWPELMTQAAHRHVPVAVCGAAVRPRSVRLHWPVRALLSAPLRAVAWLGAISAEDADRWLRLGVTPEAVTVTGDPRHDAVIERVPRLAPLGSLHSWRDGAAVMVAASTHRSDEAPLLDAAAAVLPDRPTARLVVVPHEPRAATVRRILAAATARGLDATTWQAGAPTPKTSMIVADQVGILFDLFQVADMAYVGGGFERTGLHAVVEPAAFALPTALGPVWRTSLDAAQLVAAGGALPLPRRRPARALADTWRRWLDDPPARKTAGLAARRALQAGAADTTAKAVLRLLATGPAR